MLLAAAANSSCPVTLVPGTDEAPATAPASADSISELRHVIRSYAAMGEMDILHDHTLAGPICGRPPLGTPVVTTAHGPFDATLAPIYREMRGIAVVAISHHQASTAQGVRIAGVIHHGLEVDDIPVGGGSGGYASFLGRMSPEKGPREAALVARAAGVPLRMAARLREPAEREYVEAEVEPLLCSDVEYVGELGFAEKLELVGGSFALLNPMQWAEPFGLVMIEALATGTPVVATPVGSAPEIVDEGVTGSCGRLETGSPPHFWTPRSSTAQLDRAACRAADAGRLVLRCPGGHVRRPPVVAAACESLPALGSKAPRGWPCLQPFHGGVAGTIGRPAHGACAGASGDVPSSGVVPAS